MAILAGGLGTRMAKRTGPSMPKALLAVAGRPFIDFKLDQLVAEGVQRVVLLVGYGAEAIAEHVGDGSRYGLEVGVLPDGDVLLGTGGAVLRAVPVLGPAFWITYGDTLLSVPMATVESAFERSARPGMMTVLRNRDTWDPSNVAIEEGLVTEYRKGAPPGTFEYIDYGMSLLTSGAFSAFPSGEAFDLAAVLQGLIARRGLAAFVVEDRFYEIGSEDGYQATDAYLQAGEIDGRQPPWS